MAAHARGDEIQHASWQFSAQVKEEMAGKRKKHGKDKKVSDDEDYDDESSGCDVDERATRAAARGRGRP